MTVQNDMHMEMITKNLKWHTVCQSLLAEEIHGCFHKSEHTGVLRITVYWAFSYPTKSKQSTATWSDTMD